MRKLNGFSLMEMMVVLLITSVVAAATAPIVSKKMVMDSGSESPWFWLGLNKAIVYNMTGEEHQNVHIGGKSPSDKNARVYIKQGKNTNPQIELGRATDSGIQTSYLYFGNWTTSFSTNVSDVTGATTVGTESKAGTYGAAYGYGANASGNYSVAMGYAANAESANNIAIGYSSHANGLDAIAIGRSVEVTTNNTVKIGSANHTVYLGGAKIAAGELSSTSDRRLKNVGEAFKGGLEEIKKLDVFNYVFKNDPKKTPRVGVMAQDLEKIFPNAVSKGDDGYLMIRMEDMFYAMVNAIKELDINIFDTNKRITALENKNKELEERLAALEKKSFKAEKKTCVKEEKPNKPDSKAVKPKAEKVKTEKVKAAEPKAEKPKEKVVKEVKKSEKTEVIEDVELQKPVRTEIKVKKHIEEDTEVKTED